MKKQFEVWGNICKVNQNTTVLWYNFLHNYYTSTKWIFEQNLLKQNNNPYILKIKWTSSNFEFQISSHSMSIL